MTRASMIAPVAATLALVACQPQRTPEQVQADQLATMIGNAAAIAGAAGADMTPEECAKVPTIAGAIPSGHTHPAASAYFDGANKTITLLGTVKDIATLNAIKP